MTVEEAGGPPFEVFPDNWQTVCVYLAMMTQWRMTNEMHETRSGRVVVTPIATGLDYGCLLGKHGVMAMCGVRRGDRPDVFEGIQVMEAAAMRFMQSKAKR